MYICMYMYNYINKMNVFIIFLKVFICEVNILCELFYFFFIVEVMGCLFFIVGKIKSKFE